jgi:large subunit ribosomal protein L16
MLMPKRTKYRKQQRGHRRGLATRGNYIAFGDYALQSQNRAGLPAVRSKLLVVPMTGYVKRGGKVWIRVFPDKPVTQKPAETRMGFGQRYSRILGGSS